MGDKPVRKVEKWALFLAHLHLPLPSRFRHLRPLRQRWPLRPLNPLLLLKCRVKLAPPRRRAELLVRVQKAYKRHPLRLMPNFLELRSNMSSDTQSAMDQLYLKAKAERSLYYDYTASRQFCQEIGLIWLGDNFVAAADKDAWSNIFTQPQVDIAMRHHLWQIKILFTPKNYSWRGRLLMALFFILGWKPKK